MKKLTIVTLAAIAIGCNHAPMSPEPLTYMRTGSLTIDGTTFTLVLVNDGPACVANVHGSLKLYDDANHLLYAYSWTLPSTYRPGPLALIGSLPAPVAAAQAGHSTDFTFSPVTCQ